MNPTEINLTDSDVKLESIFSMKGGQGEGSYVNNSKPQAQNARSLLPLLKETLDAMKLNPENNPFVIADLGCSTGSTSIYIIEEIIQHMIKKYESLGYEPPEFSAFFSDLPSNDFNTLFQLLPPLACNINDSLASDNNHRSYFASGVPGSFYRRLFPSRSIDVIHSAFSLHWLSKVPDIVMDNESDAYNKGKVFIYGAKESTTNAYKKQFQTDLADFLRLRAIEMKKGGSVFLVCVGKRSVDLTDQDAAVNLFGTHFQDAWNDLVEEGLITSDERDNFNVPVYTPCLQDFKEVVEVDSSFTINKLEAVLSESPIVANQPDDLVNIGQALAKFCRSLVGVLVNAHIGESLSDELFSRFASRATNHANELSKNLQFYIVVTSLSLAK